MMGREVAERGMVGTLEHLEVCKVGRFPLELRSHELVEASARAVEVGLPFVGMPLCSATRMEATFFGSI